MKMLREFWAYVREREEIRLRRRRGDARPWTQDPVLQAFPFTNVKREHDRATQIFKRTYDSIWADRIRDDIEVDWQDRLDLFVTCAIFRYFGTEKTASVLGPYSWSRPDGLYGAEYFAKLRDYGMQGDLSFTSAYIVPNCGESRDKYEVVADIVEGIQKVANEAVTAIHPEHGNSWQSATKLLTSCWGCGSFMAKEILLDFILATQEFPADWQTWTPVGPGGCRGAGWVRDGWKNKLGETEALAVIREIYATREEHDFVSPDFPKITQRREGFWPPHLVELDITDIQFQLCEFDKLNRIHDWLRDPASGKKPKRHFKPTQDGITVDILSGS